MNKEHPILFSTEMVKAILDGRKTQTRRVIKIPKYWRIKDFTGINENGCVSICCDNSGLAEWKQIPCPYGQVGDRLWVRETWGLLGHAEYNDITRSGVVYKATDFIFDGMQWKPSIHMPHWASRITLEVTGVRVERVQDITPKDALREGVCQQMRAQFGYASAESEEEFNHTQTRSTFRLLWDSINKKRGYGWYVNPWVWVIEFKVI